MKKHIHYKEVSAEALDVYHLFSQMEGSEHIATPVTIQAILDMNKEKPFITALEMGAGIGTITYTLLKYTNASVDLYEDNAYCRKALEKNLASFAGRFRIFSDYAIKPPRTAYDLFVVDGGAGKKGDGGTLQAVQFLAGEIQKANIFYIEGNRHLQRTLLRRTLAKKFRYRLVEYDRGIIEGKTFKGGLAIHCTPSAHALVRFLNFLYWELMEWTPIKQAVAYRLKRLKRIFT